MEEVKMSFTELYNSAQGVVGVASYELESYFMEDFSDLEDNPDFEFYGTYGSLEEINNEMLYHGFTLEEITKLSLNRYGDILDILHYKDTYYMFVGAR